MNTYPDTRSLYRLPWSKTDNAIAWLEATSACNLYCEGCYRANVKNSHKTLDEISHELDVFRAHRNFDGVSIAGGDPLVHPQIVDIVSMVARRGWKPVVNTNGLALSDEMLAELHRAGVAGFTFHVDSGQKRAGWVGKSELELNELRLQFAERVARVGDISVAFNSTVYEETLDDAPQMVEWAQRHADKVQVMVFICYRQAACGRHDEFDYYVGGEKIDMNDLVYSRPTGKQRLDISSRDVVAAIRNRFPDFAPSAYLNWTEDYDSLKWLLTTYAVNNGEVLGYAGPRFSEFTQNYHHLRHGRWLAYEAPSVLGRGRSLTLLGGFFDAGMRRAFRSWALRPRKWGERVRLQSVMIIQPIDVLDDGGMNMCDSCPDITVYGDELVWSCRLEELMKYGGFARAVAKKSAVAPPRLAERASTE
jgi:organic radical activating enzyme